MEETENSVQKIKRPSLLLYASEVVRAMGERYDLRQFNEHFKPEKMGDGHPILVIPGFMAGGKSTKPLRHFLRQVGYHVYDWGLGRNLGHLKNLDELLEKMEKIHNKHNQKVTLIGWSLGGVFARHLVHQRPEWVRQIITLGSPFSNLKAPNNASWLYDLIHRDAPISTLDQEWLDTLPKPLNVPSTAIYSKRDGIVPWEACMELEEGNLAQNIEINGSHIGLGVNPEVYKIIFDRLQYSEENWCPWSA
ncbi:MAG: putative alpha/beta hydrolase family esterase [Paraglaciecola sp.]|jgi:pimeloyl-ACP methyl ester carboxylesterase